MLTRSNKAECKGLFGIPDTFRYQATCARVLKTLESTSYASKNGDICKHLVFIIAKNSYIWGKKCQSAPNYTRIIDNQIAANFVA